jgi:hypothetical protein
MEYDMKEEEPEQLLSFEERSLLPSDAVPFVRKGKDMMERHFVQARWYPEKPYHCAHQPSFASNLSQHQILKEVSQVWLWLSDCYWAHP